MKMRRAVVRLGLLLSLFLLSGENVHALPKGKIVLQDKEFEGFQISEELLVEAETIATSFNATYYFFPMSKTLTISRGSNILRVLIGKRQLLINNKVYEMPFPATSIDGKIFLPIKFVLGKMGAFSETSGQSTPIKPEPTLATATTTPPPVLPTGSRITEISHSVERDYTQLSFDLTSPIRPTIRQDKGEINLLFQQMDGSHLLATRQLNSPEIQEVSFQSPAPTEILVKVKTKVSCKWNMTQSDNPPRVLVNIISDQPLFVNEVPTPTTPPNPTPDEPPPPLFGGARTSEVHEDWLIRTIMLNPENPQEGEPGGDLRENEVNRDIVLKLQQILQTMGFRVIPTRPVGNLQTEGRGTAGGNLDLRPPTTTANENPTVEKRGALANRALADLLISIDCDRSIHSQKSGITVFYDSLLETPDTEKNFSVGMMRANKRRVDPEKVKKLGGHLGKAISAVTNSQYAIYPGPIRLLNLANMPAFQLELGFLTNAPEATALHNPVTRKKIAQGIAQAIDKFNRELAVEAKNRGNNGGE